MVVDGGELAVHDEGPGIPADERAAVFDRFHRVEASRTMPGSGLGLAIVRQVVEAHGGTVFVDDSSAGGARVGFRLPTTPPGFRDPGMEAGASGSRQSG
ncbi:MAG: HAMP domain-containing sensor histidine kinase [Acidimicrobiales bacterium]